MCSQSVHKVTAYTDKHGTYNACTSSIASQTDVGALHYFDIFITVNIFSKFQDLSRNGFRNYTNEHERRFHDAPLYS